MPDLAGFVLAGGKSTRLGTDKVCLPYSGETMLQRMVSLARLFCDDIYISGRNPKELNVTEPWIQDEEQGQGPIGGIISGLRQLRRPLLVLACDLPLLDTNTLSDLVAARGKRPATAVMTTFLQQETGWIEALVSVYEPEALPLLEESAAKGVFKLSAALPPPVRHHIPYSQSEAQVFFNINFPADLAILRQVEGVGTR